MKKIKTKSRKNAFSISDVVLIGIVILAFVVGMKSVSSVTNTPGPLVATMPTTVMKTWTKTPSPTRKIIRRSLASREKELAMYSLAEPSELLNLPNNMVLYKYRKGNLYPDLERWGYHKNYDLVFPNTWNVYTYTNKNMDEYYGTNVILRKGDDVIYISQQQNEDGVCQLTNEDVGMSSYKCNLIHTFVKPRELFRVYTIDYTNLDHINESPWIIYGVCEMFKGNGGAPCSPGLQVGKITFNDVSRNQDNFIEFVNIVENIKVID